MAYKKPRPILRQEAWNELQSSLVKILNNPRAIPYQNCLNCKHWNYGQEICNRFNSRPPADVIVYSCDYYDDNDDIPF